MNSSKSFLRDWFLITKREFHERGGLSNGNLCRKAKSDGVWQHFMRRYGDG